MKLKTLLMAVVTILTIGNENIYSQSAQNSDSIHRAMQISFVPYMGTDGLNSRKISYNSSFNMLGGIVRDVNGAQLGGLLNITLRNASGCEVAGIGSIAGNTVSGLQMSGIFNQAKNVQGIQVAGIVNNTTTMQGAQVAGIANNKTNGNAVQIAGICNNALRGQNTQIAGIANNSDSANVQIAGIVNRANTVSGTQISGLVNVAKKVKGVQIGVINIADSCKASIGLITIVKHGIHQMDIYGDELFYSNIAFRSGTRGLHTILTAGIRPDDLGAPLWTYGWGIGTSQALSSKTFLDIEGIFSHIVKNGDCDNNYLYKAGISIDHRITRNVSLVMGLTYNFFIADTDNRKYNDTYSKITHYTFTNHTYSNDYNMKSWLGAKIGLRFF